MIKAVIFDLDGVLIDSELFYRQKRKEYLESHGIRLDDEQLSRFDGQRFLVALEQVCDFLPPEQLAEIKADFYPWKISFEEHFRPEARKVMLQLKEMGLGVAIASNSVASKIGEFLLSCDLEDLVDGWVSGEYVPPKPAPDLYYAAAKKMGLLPRQCVAVEDSDYGLQAAFSAGCYVICLIDKRLNFKQTQAHQWIRSLSRLPDTVQMLMRSAECPGYQGDRNMKVEI